jgi:hypothetical protein
MAPFATSFIVRDFFFLAVDNDNDQHFSKFVAAHDFETCRWLIENNANAERLVPTTSDDVDHLDFTLDADDEDGEIDQTRREDQM